VAEHEESRPQAGGFSAIVRKKRYPVASTSALKQSQTSLSLLKCRFTVGDAEHARDVLQLKA
jgi:hypothetical protein